MPVSCINPGIWGWGAAVPAIEGGRGGCPGMKSGILLTLLTDFSYERVFERRFNVCHITYL
jgi:hypothetical protein